MPLNTGYEAKSDNYGVFNIKVNQGLQTPIKWTLMDISGKKLVSQTVEPIMAEEGVMIDIGNFKNGFYLLQVQVGKIDFTKKIVKN